MEGSKGPGLIAFLISGYCFRVLSLERGIGQMQNF